jgi:hypothetical protein
MFRLVQLIAIAAAASVSDDEKQAKTQIDKNYKAIGNMIDKNAKILHNKFEMPMRDGHIPTYELMAREADEYCV